MSTSKERAETGAKNYAPYLYTYLQVRDTLCVLLIEHDTHITMQEYRDKNSNFELFEHFSWIELRGKWCLHAQRQQVMP